MVLFCKTVINKKQTEECMKGGNKKKPFTSSIPYYDKISSFLSTKQAKTIILLLLLLIPMFMAGYYRSYPAWLPATQDWAGNSIRESVISDAQAQIRKDFPLAPAAQVRAKAQEEWQKYYLANKELIDSQKQQLAKSFKDRLQLNYASPDGEQHSQTYFLAIDPYVYLRAAELYARTGSVCDEIIEGRCIDNHALAPVGRTMTMNGHIWIMSQLIRISDSMGLHPMTFTFFIPVFFAMLSIIPAFFIVRKKYGNLAGFVSAVIVATHTAFLGRTPAGFVDTDVYNVFFPLYIIWLVLLGIESKTRARYAYFAVAGVLSGLYTVFWTGWTFTFLLVTAALTGALVIHLIRYYIHNDKYHKIKLVQESAGLGVYLLSTVIVGIIVAGKDSFIDGFTSLIAVSTGLQAPTTPTLWPNVLTTVAELNTVSIPAIIGQLGGRFFFILASIGMFAFLLKDKKISVKEWTGLAVLILYYTILTSKSGLSLTGVTLGFLPVSVFYLFLFAIPMIVAGLYVIISKEEYSIEYGLVIMLWFLSLIYAVTQGTRFMLLLVPIYALAIGLFVGILYKLFPYAAKEYLDIPGDAGKLIVVVLVLLVLFAPVRGAMTADIIRTTNAVAKNEVPSMNDAWWDSLTKIKEDSNKDAIITSWWDFGHWFKYVADRAVSFDGASQNHPNAHWVGKMLQTNDPVQSIGILRMINCGSTGAYDALEEELNDNLRTYQLINKIILMPKDKARDALLDEGIPEQVADDVLSKSHCTPPESYFIVSSDMVGKAGVWGHFGLWDFNKSFVYNVAKDNSRETAVSLIQEKLGVDIAKATELYTQVKSLKSSREVNTWISPWPGYIGLRNCQANGDYFVCNVGAVVGNQGGVNLVANQLVIDMTNITNTTILVTANGQVVGNVQPKTLIINDTSYDLNGDYPISVDVRGDKALLSDDVFTKSQFGELFFWENPGDFYTTLTKAQQISGGKIIVYKVNWDAYFEAIGE